MSRRVRFQDHVFSSTRGGVVTLLSLQFDTIIRLRGPVVDVWAELMAAGDLAGIAARLKLRVSDLEGLVDVLVAEGFVVSDTLPAEKPIRTVTWSWPGVGSLDIEEVNEKYTEAYSWGHLINDGEQQQKP